MFRFVKLILITYLFLELQFLLLIGIRKGKLNFLLMTCKLQQKLAISNFLANQVHLFHAFPKLFYLTSWVLNFYHLVSYICVLIIKIAINLAILYLESIHLTMRRKKHAYELIEPERGVVDIYSEHIQVVFLLLRNFMELVLVFIEEQFSEGL